MKSLKFLVPLLFLTAMIFTLNTQPASAASGPEVPLITDARIHYGTVIWETTPRADGKIHVDTPATIARAKELKANTFAFLLWQRSEDWDDFRYEFLPAAQEAGMKVWAYLTPKSEGYSLPYKGDFKRWAEELAALSITYPVLEAWGIDDFTANLDEFTPAKVREIQDYALAINPKFALIACIYVYSVDDAFADLYKDVIDGVIFPHAERTEINLERDLNQLYEIFHPRNTPIYFTPYTTFSNYSSMKSAEMVEKEMEIAYKFYKEGKIQGFFIYATPMETTDELWLLPNDPNPYPSHGDWYYEFTNDELIIPWDYHHTEAGANATVSQTAAVTTPNNTSISFDAYSYAEKGYEVGGYARISFPAVPGGADIYGEISQEVHVTDGANASISFKVKDMYDATAASGYIFKQFLIDDVVVWEEDVSGGDANWEQITLPLGDYLKDKSTAKIQLRQINKKAVEWFPAVTNWADIEATGFEMLNPGFEGNEGWTKKRSGEVSVNPYFSIAYPAVPSGAGDVGAKDMIAVMQEADEYKLEMQVKDDYTGVTGDYHMMQMLVDGALVWEKDIAGGTLNWEDVSLDLTSQLHGKTDAVITFQVYEKNGVYWHPIKTEWKIISSSGFTLSDGNFHNSNNNWIYADSNPNPYLVEIAPYSSKVQLQLLIDGDVIWSRDASQIIANPWARYTVDTSAYTTGKNAVDVTFRMYIAKDINSLPVIIRLDNVGVEGLTMHNLSFEDTTAWTSTFTDQNVVSAYGGPKRGVRVFNIIREYFKRIAPMNLTATAGDGFVTLNWNAVTGTGTVSYAVYQVTGASAPTDPSNWIPVQADLTSATYTVTGLTNGTSYAFAVKAIVAGDASDFSNAATATPRASGGGGGWSAGNSSHVTSTNGAITIPVGSSGEVSPGGQIIIKVPVGAAAQELRITIEKLLDTSGLGTERGMPVSQVFEVLKNFSGNFIKSVTLSIQFDPSKVGNDQKAAIFYYDEEKKTWIEVGGTVDGEWITAEVDHFTKYAVLGVDVKKDDGGETPKQPDPTFTDIAGHWGEKSIVRAAAQKLVSGYPDGTFKPNNAVTRAEFTVMLVGALKLDEPIAALNFTDRAKIGAWAKRAVALAVQAEIISGYEDGSFRPDAQITRAEMASMIAKALKVSLDSNARTGFADDDAIPKWAKGAVEAIRNLGIVSGRGGNKFVPNDTATRAEAVVMLLRMLEDK